MQNRSFDNNNYSYLNYVNTKINISYEARYITLDNTRSSTVRFEM